MRSRSPWWIRRRQEAPKPGFDVAKQSIVTGITVTSGQRELWVTVRTEGRVLKLREGDEIALGSIKGIVSRIDASGAEIKTGDGGVLTVALGKSLVSNVASPTGGI